MNCIGYTHINSESQGEERWVGVVGGRSYLGCSELQLRIAVKNGIPAVPEE